MVKETAGRHHVAAGLIPIKSEAEVGQVQLSQKMNARFALDRRGEIVRFVDLVSAKGNRLVSGLNVHDLIETMAEFLNRQLHDTEEYSVVEEGRGYNARLGTARGVPELHIDVINNNEVVETLHCRRFEMRVIIKKLQALLAQTRFF